MLDAVPLAPVRRRRTPRLLAAVPSLLALGTLLVEPSPTVMRKDDTFITAATPGILNIEGAECFTDPTYSVTADEKVVLYRACDEGAANQSYGFLLADDGAYDRPALAEFARRGCERGFREQWGERETAESALDFYPVLPTAETWAGGDRDIMCVVYSPRGELTKSMLPLL
ncbi:hypothetical protein [Streptomyces paludis]|uniref:Septum formation-related domain-containing protein n=1 Tax=Streptomyces paludis TaxID=2282738 RepID=A0A345HN19_9ACTN|nr:hypothetical protein [Streptomyces paludis]AXG78093.1 hypothetical protein DVK44_10675 [Streptomyces paludis]